MQKIILISDDVARSKAIRAMIEAHMPYQVFIAYDSAAIKSQLESRVFNLAIVDVSYLDDEYVQLTTQLKHAGNSFAQIFLAEMVEPSAYKQLQARGDVHFLQSPVNEKNLLGLVRKLLVSKKVPKQIHQRYNTNQIAQVETLSTGNNLLTSMYNLSKGGAYCEFDNQNVLTVGDVIRIRVALSDNNKEYTFNAKVVWTTIRGRFSGRFGCGFKFVSGSDIYGSMRF